MLQDFDIEQHLIMFFVALKHNIIFIRREIGRTPDDVKPPQMIDRDKEKSTLPSVDRRGKSDDKLMFISRTEEPPSSFSRMFFQTKQGPKKRRPWGNLEEITRMTNEQKIRIEFGANCIETIWYKSNMFMIKGWRGNRRLDFRNSL